MENQYLIAGLGNPGRDYVRTRHNVGFMVVEKFAATRRAEWSQEKKFRARLARIRADEGTLVLCLPETFMNCSGEAISALLNYYQIPQERLLVAVDDADLGFGEVRLRANGSSGGHHGLESIEQHLGSREYPRQRIGIGRQTPGVREITNYVLSPFAKGEAALLEKVLTRACDQIECWLREGIQKAMSRYNGSVENALET